MDAAKVNQVEGDLDAFISRRDKQRRETEGDRREWELYEESCRRYAEAQQQALAWEWLRWHQRMLNSHIKTSALITSHHEDEIRRYERLLNINLEKE